jgi:neurexin
MKLKFSFVLENSQSKVDRPFVGIIAGLVFNGIRVLDLAAERDPKIQIRGEIELLTSIPADYRQRFKDNNQSMQRAPESAYPNVVDDLVFSGAGSGCVSSTVDDECVPSYNTGRGGNILKCNQRNNLMFYISFSNDSFFFFFR